MALRVRTTLTIHGDRTLLERASKNLRATRTFMERVGVLGLSAADRRLSTVLRQDEKAIRTGDLARSLTRGGEGNVFDVGAFSVEVGTGVHYAAQVQHGGTIFPKNVKALAIPVNDRLKRQQLGPRDIDPTRELLRFVPFSTGKPNIIGGLIDEGETDDQLAKRRETKKRAKRKKSATGYGEGLLFVLAYWVTQQPRPFLFWSDAELREIETDLFPRWVRG